MTGPGPLQALPLTILDVSHAHEFLSKFTELYLDSFMSNIMIGVLLGALGLFVILRRLVFLSAALSQVSGAGLALAFFLGAILAHQTQKPQPEPQARPGERLDEHKPEDDADQDIQDFLKDDEDDEDAPAAKPARGPGTTTGPRPASPRRPAPPDRAGTKNPGARPTARGPAMATGPPVMGSPGAARVAPQVPKVHKRYHHGRHEPMSPILLSLIITCLVALLLSESGRGQRRFTQESLVGLVFILASAASIVLAQLAEKGAHEIAELLFGTVIFIPRAQQHLIYAVGAVTLILYTVLFKDFVFVSFDPTSARASGFPVRVTNGVLFLLIAVSIAICTRAVGAMPVFALTVLPPAAALLIHDRLLPAVITSAGVGAVSAAGGYFLSGLLNLSAGPLIVIVGAVIVGITWLVRAILNKVTALRARRESEHA